MWTNKNRARYDRSHLRMNSCLCYAKSGPIKTTSRAPRTMTILLLAGIPRMTPELGLVLAA